MKKTEHTASAAETGAVSARVKQVIERHPGLSSSQIHMRMSGVTIETVKKALVRLLLKEQVRREKHGSCYAWHVSEQERPVLRGPTKNIHVNYEPPPYIVTRADAFAHEQAKSLRGGQLVPHQKPLDMCVGRLADHISHEAVKLKKPSPLDNVSYQRTPMPAPLPAATPVAAKKQEKAFERLHGDDVVAKVLELKARGKSHRQIQEATGVSRSSVGRMCDAGKDNNRMPPRQKPPQKPINAPRRRQMEIAA